MKKSCICLLLLIMQEVAYSQLNKTDKEDEDFAFSFVPATSVINQCYKSFRLDSVFKQLPKQKSGDRQPKLSDGQLDSLNDIELLIYVHKYPESFSQICSLFPTDKELNKKLQAYLPLVTFGAVSSKRQMDAVLKKRTSVISLIEKCLVSNSKSDAELNRSIISLKAHELIPTIADIIQKQENVSNIDTYLYTILMLLMKNDHYQPFTSSETYKALYESNKSYWKSNIIKTTENSSFVIKMANEYYSSKIYNVQLK